jgi:hypothetical protein
MLVKRVRMVKHRYADHSELIQRESWWLFGVIPLYVRDSLSASSL